MRLFVLLLLISGFFHSSAATQEASLASGDLPFDFIPDAFQGHWIITGFHLPFGKWSRDIEPEQYIGKEIIIENERVSIFGHECIVLGFDTSFEKIELGDALFDRTILADPDIKDQYPYKLLLNLKECSNNYTVELLGDAIQFETRESLYNYLQLAKYEDKESSNFIALTYPNGPEFILRPIMDE